MFGTILAVFASAVIVTATLFVLWGLAQARADLLARSLLFVVCLLELFAVVSTWIWAMKWRHLGLISPWRFIVGSRPDDQAELSAWKWGRRAWISWLLIMVSIFGLVLTQIR